MATQRANINISATSNSSSNGRATQSAITNNNRQLADGTADGQADKTYYAVRQVTTGYPITLDLVGGGLIDANGDALSLVEVTTFIVQNKSETVAEVFTIGGGSNPFDFGCGNSGVKSLKAGECSVLIDMDANPAYPVTSSSHDSIQISVASGTLVEIEVYIAGRSS